jgi:EAL domain-containing protein (putative c-di-GMP-specific phosphodiesterase class I)
VRAIIALCKSLNIVVTAEGVETDIQADILRLEDCDYLQGFLLGRPSTTEDMGRFFFLANVTPQG